ncbi:MAG TPA: outer membrane beta-barrel protein [Chitinophagaceae bacterium]|nr:outer membrane beta-barrel protein [Chitinophagaceae bacterium]
MKIKVFSFSAMLLLAASASNAQSGSYIKGGINLANVSVTDNGRVDDANQLTSFQVGIVGNIKLGTSLLSLQPGLLYTGKGAKVQKGTAGQTGYFKQTFNPKYIEVPVNLVFKAPLGKVSRVFLGAGPYAAIGVAGNAKTEGTNILGRTYSRENDIEFSNDDPTTFNEEEGAGLGVVRRFDYGLNGTVGIEGKSYVLGVNYGLGLAKLQSGSNSSADNSNKHRVLSFTLGFKF